MVQTAIDRCSVCRHGAAATAVRVYDPMSADEVRAEWAFVCRPCAPAVDRIVSAMLAENPRLRVRVTSLWLPVLRRAA